jgi:hypothetical protein
VGPADQREGAACSFCGKGPADVGHLVAGPGVWICDGCVRVCAEILDGIETGSRADVPAGTTGTPDPVMAEIARAQQVALGGDREAAAAAFTEIWARLGPEANRLHRVTLAHYAADVQAGPDDALDWDLRALAAADSVPAEDPASASLRGMYASLQVNVAARLHAVGRVEEARHHLAEARAAEPDLPPDGYGRLVRAEIERVRGLLDG